MKHAPPLSAFVFAQLFALASAHIGFCNDKEASCGAWARDGECSGDNAEHVKSVCPHSCAVCSLVCGDKEASCSEWAKQGQCKSNAGYMHQECPTSCGLCAPRCADIHADCNHWFKEGECTKNAEFMNLNWHVMLCRRTCLRHSALLVRQRASTESCDPTQHMPLAQQLVLCALRTRVHPIRAHSPVSCGVCLPLCKDQHNDCPGWAREGECASNPGHALKTCPVSCGLEVCYHRECFDKNKTVRVTITFTIRSLGRRTYAQRGRGDADALCGWHTRPHKGPRARSVQHPTSRGTYQRQ